MKSESLFVESSMYCESWVYGCDPETVIFLTIKNVGLGGLGVTCSPRDPRFAASNPSEVNGFFSERKNPEHKSSGRDFKLGVPSLRFQAR